jgi:hemerythrin-like domain-containing protein
MTQATTLLNDDGSASIATAILMSHHAFRRDIARFAGALEKVVSGDSSKVEALRFEWSQYRGALHGHHEVEDANIFPSVKEQDPTLVSVVEGLSDDHRQIDPLLERGDRAFAGLPNASAAAASVVSELAALLDAHLSTEEASVIPFLRGVTDFPAPPSEEMLAMYAQGFAWSSDGVAPEVLQAVDKMLPRALTSLLPTARAEFQARCDRVWGPLPALVSRTSVPLAHTPG